MSSRRLQWDPPPPNESLTKNLRNGDLGEFGKCRNRAFGRRIL